MAIRKPKAKKLPKKPKRTASNEVKENYIARRDQIIKDNAKALKDWSAAKTKSAQLDKKIANPKKIK